jgi:hypothetical protein
LAGLGLQLKDFTFFKADLGKLSAFPFKGGEFFYSFDKAFDPELVESIEALLRATPSVRRYYVFCFSDRDQLLSS